MKILLLLFLVGCFCLPESKASFWSDVFLLDFTPGPHQASQNDVNQDQDHDHDHDHNHHQGHSSSGQHDHSQQQQQQQQQQQHQQHDHSHHRNHDATGAPLKITAPQGSRAHGPQAQYSRGNVAESEAQGGPYVFNASSPHSPVCPMLYTLVGDRCVALFTVARVPWSAAREFCQGIFGDLITFTNVHEYTDLLNYLQTSELDVDLWIGGREEVKKTHEWVWLDDTPMPRGSPYWAIRLDETASRSRYVLHKNIVYTQAPFPSRTLQLDRCAAMTSKYFYYLTDEWCRLWKSPVCVLKKDAEVVMVRGGEDTYPGIFLPPDDTSNVLVTEGTRNQATTTTSSPPRTVVGGGGGGPMPESKEDLTSEGSREDVDGSGSMPDDLYLLELGVLKQGIFIDEEE